MIFAALGDINGNVLALNAVLRDVEERGILTILQTGNMALGHGGGNEVVARVRGRATAIVQGLDDRLLARFRRKEASLRRTLEPARIEELAAAHDRLSSDAVEYLHRLPRHTTITVDGISILVCHGSPGSQNEVLDAATPEQRFAREREITPADIIVCGGAHEFFARQIASTLFVGPGWVDAGPGEAGYALVSTEETPWRAEYCRVPLAS